MSEEVKPNTKEIVVGEHKVAIRTSLTARQYTQLKNYIVRHAQMETKVDGYDKHGSPKTATVPSISGETIVGLEKETMETYVVSFNGDENNAYNRMMDTITGTQYETVKSAVDSAFEAESKK